MKLDLGDPVTLRYFGEPSLDKHLENRLRLHLNDSLCDTLKIRLGQVLRDHLRGGFVVIFGYYRGATLRRSERQSRIAHALRPWTRRHDP